MRPFEPLTYEELPPRLKTALPEDASDGLKFAAANANLPLLSEDLVTCLFYLCSDKNPDIRNAARRSLTSLPNSLLIPVLSSEISPKILHWFANRKIDDPIIYEKIILNKSTQQETIVTLSASLENSSLLDLITQNQRIFIKAPEILEALAANSHTPLASLDRASEFFKRQTGKSYQEILAERRRFEEISAEAVTLDAEPEPISEPIAPEIATTPEGEIAAEAVVPSADVEVILGEELPPDFSLEDLEKEVLSADDAFSEDLLIDPQIELENEVRESLSLKINKMSVLNKMRLALKGNIEARGILIKSSNKLIQECVLRNPRISIEEVIKLSKDKTQREDLIRIIAANRDWVKNYQVLVSLCWNPKTPVEKTGKFLPRLNIRDLVSLSRSKQIPGLIAVQARKLAAEKEKLR